MQDIKDMLIRVIGVHAAPRSGQLASELVRATPEDKELVLAELELLHWLTESCHDCLDHGQKHHSP